MLKLKSTTKKERFKELLEYIRNTSIENFDDVIEYIVLDDMNIIDLEFDDNSEFEEKVVI